MNAPKLPDLFLNRLTRIIPETHLSEVLASFSLQRKTTIRVNSLKTSREKTRKALSENSIQTSPVDWYEYALKIDSGGVRELQSTQAFQNGEFYIQNLSSMLPVIVLNPQPGETVLDMTAAPGSKTTQIAMHMKGQGQLTANDNHRQRFFKMKSVLEQQGVLNVQLACKYGESFGRSHPGFFDKILLDAPCSTEGRFTVRDPDSFRYWKPSKCKEMSKKQKRLILSAVQALKPGGILVYSTCTFAPEENEEVLNWMLQKVGDEVLFEEMTLPIGNVQKPLLEWNDKQYNAAVENALRVLPNDQMEAFFIAKLRKKA